MVSLLGRPDADVAAAAVQLPPSPDLFQRGGAFSTMLSGTVPYCFQPAVFRMVTVPLSTASNTFGGVVLFVPMPRILNGPTSTVLSHPIGMGSPIFTKPLAFLFGVVFRPFLLSSFLFGFVKTGVLSLLGALDHDVLVGHQKHYSRRLPSWAKVVDVVPDAKS